MIAVASIPRPSADDLACEVCKVDLAAAFDPTASNGHQGWLVWLVTRGRVDVVDLHVRCQPCHARAAESDERRSSLRDIPLERWSGLNALPTLERLLADYAWLANLVPRLVAAVRAGHRLATGRGRPS